MGAAPASGPRVRAWLPSARVAHVRAREAVSGGHEQFEAYAAHVERAVAEEASEERERPGEYHLPEPVDPVGEGLTCLDEASITSTPARGVQLGIVRQARSCVQGGVPVERGARR